MGCLCCKQKDTNTDRSVKVSFDAAVAEMQSSMSQISPSSDSIVEGEFKSLVKHITANETLCSRIPIMNMIIHPFGPFRLIWDSLVVLALLYTSIAVPYTLTFGIMLTVTEPAGIIALIIDLFLLVDIVINFRTAYIDKYDHLHIITAPKAIAKKYLKSWFWLDLISSLPFEFTVPLFLNQDENITEIVKMLRIFRLLRGLKMLRVLRIFKLFKGFGRYVYVREAAMTLKCVRCLAAMLITAHYFACFWYMVGWQTQKNGKESWLQIIDENHENASNFTKYSYSWYWAIVTLFTTGYGDIHAYNEEEQWTASFCILAGTCFFAYFIGVLTTLLEEGDRVRMYELERVEEAQLFCAHHRLPRQLARAIVTHIRYHCNYNYLFDHRRILESIPTYLQNHVTQHLSQSLAELDMFKNLPLSVIGQIALKMTSTSCNSGHTLFKKGELSHEFYIQRTGRSVLQVENSIRKTRILERGDVCGEYAILSGKHRDSVKCLTWSEFYVVDINDLLSVLRDNFIDAKVFLTQYKHIKTVLRKTLQKATKRKVKFSNKLQKENGDFIHEFSRDATHSTINTYFADATYIQQLNIPSPQDLDDDEDTKTKSTFNKVHYQHLQNSSSSRLIRKLSGILQRQNSAGRHEIVIKKPNALSMDVARLDTAHRAFEYSDHEDSHFYSENNHHHDIIHHSIPNHRRRQVGLSRKSGGGKFGGKKRHKHNHTRKSKSFGKKMARQIADMVHGLKTDKSDIDDDSVEQIALRSEAGTETMSMDSDDNDICGDIDKTNTTLTVPKQQTVIEMGKRHGLQTPQASISHKYNHELNVIQANQEFQVDGKYSPDITPVVSDHNCKNSDENDEDDENDVFLYSIKEIDRLDNIDET